MKVKAFLIDFDGTLVTQDILDVICGLTGKREESERLHAEMLKGKNPGLSTLIQRINFLHGVRVSDIHALLSNEEYLQKGAESLFEYLNTKGIISILNSGNIIPVLQYFQKRLGITYLVGTHPRMIGDKIDSISESDFPTKNFKLEGCKRILEKLSITPGETVAIGDSPVDGPLFDYAGASIAINPKKDVHADYVISDLSEAIPILARISLEKLK